MPNQAPRGEFTVGSTSSSLLARVRSRDQEAWRRLVALYGPLVHGWCASAGLQSDDVADIFQEVFAAVAANLDQFHRTQPGDSFRAWLRVIARNKQHDFFRRRAAQPQAQGGSTAHGRLQELPAEPPADDTPLSNQENAALARRALELIQTEFEERTWRAFWLSAVEGRSPPEIGQELGMTPVAVRKAKSRVLLRLRAEFADLLDLPV